MIKKLYQKDGFILIDNSKEHHVRGIDKNFFIVKKISEKPPIKEVLSDYFPENKNNT